MAKPDAGRSPASDRLSCAVRTRTGTPRYRSRSTSPGDAAGCDWHRLRWRAAGDEVGHRIQRPRLAADGRDIHTAARCCRAPIMSRRVPMTQRARPVAASIACTRYVPRPRCPASAPNGSNRRRRHRLAAASPLHARRLAAAARGPARCRSRGAGGRHWRAGSRQPPRPADRDAREPCLTSGPHWPGHPVSREATVTLRCPGA
jgi:hypothetical protein